eukprot:CAMPEP_0170558744 /NCGR_PEP_ID=MMETSP0211-20121228/37556_1 /TAXON_ID=311385 /ORGANISM="Pseudokeronopsis sp., Strain OXSARD2" /LENGTH=87 /DNA_ID=CAMNT_0010870999 /DNA_START=238 /DNA_END=501 /DNA_ORIENTATION=+
MEQKKEYGVEEAVNEGSVVAFTNAVSHPRAMMVHPQHTDIAIATMMASRRLDLLTDAAVQVVIYHVEDHLGFRMISMRVLKNALSVF